MATKVSLPGLTGGVKAPAVQTAAQKAAAAKAAAAQAAAAKAAAAKAAAAKAAAAKAKAKKKDDGVTATTGTIWVASDGTEFKTEEDFKIYQAKLDEQKKEQEAGSSDTAFIAATDKILSDTLTNYGLAGMADTIAKIRAAYPKASSEDLLFILKNDANYNAEYNKRFAGNAALKKAGLPTLSDAEYLKTENEFKKIFTSYGATNLATQSYYATLIANRMDAVDVAERITLAYDRLQATPEVKKAFKDFYSAVTDGDIVSAMLDPTTQIPVLEKKVKAAEIGGAALLQNLETSLLRAQELEGYGVTGAAAMAGYQAIAPKVKRGKFLTEISPETGIKYTQTTAEDIQFKKNAEAKRQEDVLVGTEIGRFGGTSGRLASKQRAQGAF
jgi:hypothetical protein